MGAGFAGFKLNIEDFASLRGFVGRPEGRTNPGTHLGPHAGCGYQLETKRLDMSLQSRDWWRHEKSHADFDTTTPATPN